MREYRVLLASDVRYFCNVNGFYTRGTNEDYDKLLSFVHSLHHFDTCDIFAIATDIKEHSDCLESINEISRMLDRISVHVFVD